MTKKQKDLLERRLNELERKAAGIREKLDEGVKDEYKESFLFRQLNAVIGEKWGYIGCLEMLGYTTTYKQDQVAIVTKDFEEVQKMRKRITIAEAKERVEKIADYEEKIVSVVGWEYFAKMLIGAMDAREEDFLDILEQMYDFVKGME